jgi:hypothetical protein
MLKRMEGQKQQSITKAQIKIQTLKEESEKKVRDELEVARLMKIEHRKIRDEEKKKKEIAIQQQREVEWRFKRKIETEKNSKFFGKGDFLIIIFQCGC